MHLRHPTAPSPMHAQRGGTILGLIIGILIGLFVALALAVWVTKIPVPFAPKNYGSGVDLEQERERNKNWQPNAPLSGAVTDLSANTVKIPAEPAEDKASAWAGLEDPSPAPAASSAEPNHTPTPKPTRTPTPDALAQLLESKQEKPAATAPPAAPVSSQANEAAFTYYVQIGAFANRDEAEALKAQSALYGLSASMSENEQNGRTIHRVRLGPYDNKEAADAARAQMQNNGVSGVLVRIQR